MTTPAPVASSSPYTPLATSHMPQSEDAIRYACEILDFVRARMAPSR
jgi:hypothetical protein